MSELGERDTDCTLKTDSSAVGIPTEEQLKLHRQLASLVENGANRFNPVRFRYIESMARRALDKDRAVALIVEKKVQQSLTEYQSELALAKEDAAMSVEHVTGKFPNSADSVKQLFASSDFKGVKRLEAKLVRDKTQSSKNHETLASLTQQFFQNEAVSDKNTKHDSLDNSLWQQEHELVDSSHSDSEQFGELKSVRLFRESWSKMSSDKLVTRAIKEGPKNAGPLNQQMLAIRSLTTMRKLSPQYLNRFISYIDTLFWLEQAGGASVSGAKKKSSGKSKLKNTVRRRS